MVVCLRPLDALTLWMNRIRKCTFIYKGGIEESARLLDAMRTERVESVRLCFPNTLAGTTAAERCGVDLFCEGFEVCQARFPFGMGAYEYAAVFENPRAALHNLIAAARELAYELRAAGKDGFFTRRQLRERIGRGATQTGKHIERLRDLGLVSLIQCRTGCVFRYEINENGGAD